MISFWVKSDRRGTEFSLSHLENLKIYWVSSNKISNERNGYVVEWTEFSGERVKIEWLLRIWWEETDNLVMGMVLKLT